MDMKVYSIFDEQVKCFMTPFFSHTHGSAVRSFKDLCLDRTSTVSKNLEDFSLYCIADYNDTSGAVSPFPQPELVMRAINFKEA